MTNQHFIDNSVNTNRLKMNVYQNKYVFNVYLLSISTFGGLADFKGHLNTYF